jgi:ribosomal protein S18 acetylase RimI-like enzyme
MIDLPAIEGALTALVSGSAVEELQVLLERCADFEILITGTPPGPTAAEDLLVDAPEDHPLRDKFVIGVWTDQGLTAAIDLLRHFPQEHVWYVGLLLVAPEARGQGLGAQVVEALVGWVRRQGGRALRLVVQEQNPRAMAFWRAHDFQPIGTAVQELEARTNQVTRMERRI